MSSYILVRLRFACFDYEHELAVRDLQVTCWNEAGISTGYKHKKIGRLCRDTAASFYVNTSLKAERNELNPFMNTFIY